MCRMSFTVMRAAHVDNHTDYFVLVYDCGGETNVKGYLMARRDKLISNGYTMILGLRDVYPNFEREEVPNCFRGLNHQLPQKKARTHIYLAIMETEAWFLGEYNHLRKVSRKLTPEFMEKHLGFNPSTENMEERENPAEDMKAVYQLVGMIIPRNGTGLMLWLASWILTTLLMNWPGKMPSLGTFVEGLEHFSRRRL